MKVLLIWLGKMWQFHLNNLLQIPEIEKIYAFDVFEETFKLKSDKIIYSTKLEEFENLDYDFVDIVAPTKFHFSYLEKFIKLNKNIFVEKPMVSDLDEFKKLEEIIKQTNYNKNICVWFIERFNVVSKQFKNYIQNFWEPRQIEIFRYNPWSWRIQDVDVTTDLMIHDIDLINYFFEDKNVEILWKSCQNDSSTVLLKVWDTSVTLWANRITQQKIRQIKFYYDDKTIVWDLMLWKIEIYHKVSEYVTSKWQDLNISYLLEEKILPKTNQLKEELQEFVAKIKWNKCENISTYKSSEKNLYVLKI